jgi:glycine/sarcosine N-methyltransferase
LVEPTGVATAWVVGLMAERGVEPGELVVDAGCGTGRQARELARAGYRVIGVDRSAELVAAGRVADEQDVELVVGDLLRWRPERPAAAVLCRGVLNDLLGSGERERALGALAAMMRPGGLLVGDVRDRERSADRYGVPRTTRRAVGAEEGELTLEAESRWDGEEIVVDERIRLGPRRWRHEMRMRPWTRTELEGGLAAAGLGGVEFHDPGAAGARDDRLVFSALARA